MCPNNNQLTHQMTKTEGSGALVVTNKVTEAATNREVIHHKEGTEADIHKEDILHRDKDTINNSSRCMFNSNEVEGLKDV